MRGHKQEQATTHAKTHGVAKTHEKTQSEHDDDGDDTSWLFYNIIIAIL